MLLTFGAAGRKALVYGVTTSSSVDSITVYWTPGTVSPPALSAVRKEEPCSCSTQAAHGPSSRPLIGSMRLSWMPSSVMPSRVVPLLLGASATSLSTLVAPPRFLM